MITVQVLAKGSTDLFRQQCKTRLLKVTGLTDSEIVTPGAVPIVKQALESKPVRVNTILHTGLKVGFSIVKERNGEYIGTLIKRERNGRLIVRSVRQPVPESHARQIRSKKDLMKAITSCITVYSRLKFGKLKGWHKIPKTTAMAIANQIGRDESPQTWKLDGTFAEIRDRCLYLGK